MEHKFKLRAENKNPENENFIKDFDFMYLTIEDSIEIERRDEDYVHEEIMIEITAIKELKGFIENLVVFEFPTPICDNKEDGMWFFPRFTVKELEGNNAKVQLEYINSDKTTRPEIIWGEFK